VTRKLLEYQPLYEIAAPLSALPESGQLKLAARLLEVSDGAALAAYLREVVRASGAGPRLAARGMAGPLMRELARGMRSCLPLWSRIDTAAHILGLELEGLSQEDKEFALARQFQRFASEVVHQAAAWRGPPLAGVRHAIELAARRHAPGMRHGCTVVPPSHSN
jgi:hypothetical protein